jgi:prepilin-type processing-associated H-X9-DG protein
LYCKGITGNIPPLYDADIPFTQYCSACVLTTWILLGVRKNLVHHKSYPNFQQLPQLVAYREGNRWRCFYLNPVDYANKPTLHCPDRLGQSPYLRRPSDSLQRSGVYPRAGYFSRRAAKPNVRAGQYGTSGHGAARGVGGVFICPSHPDPKQVFHYGVHESIFRGCWWGSPGEIRPCTDPSASLAQIDRPADIAMVLEKGRADFQDIRSDGTSNSWPFFQTAGHVWAWENPAAGWPSGPANRNATGFSYPNPDRDWAPRTWDGVWPHSAVMPRFRHNNTTTTVFTDGHAKAMQKGRLNWVDHIYIEGLNSWGSAR